MSNWMISESREAAKARSVRNESSRITGETTHHSQYRDVVGSSRDETGLVFRRTHPIRSVRMPGTGTIS